VRRIADNAKASRAQRAGPGAFSTKQGIPLLVAVGRLARDKSPYPRQSRHRAAVSRWKKTLPIDVSGAPPE